MGKKIDGWTIIGSSTVLVTAHKNDRRGLGIEIEPKYVAVTLQRLADMSLHPQLVSQAAKGD